jgi:RNA polymerase sporulation-specific sigma factor
MSAPTPELLEAARQGDRTAEERLITENSRLIWSIVRRYVGRGVEQDDLYQLGCIGFLKAIKGFDPDYGTQFSTYAVPKIAGEMRRFLRDDGAVKVSRTLRERAARIAQAKTAWTAQRGCEPTVRELADYLMLEPEEVAMAETAGASVISLSAETGDGLTLESMLGDEGMEEQLVEHLDLRWAIAQLEERERLVVIARYYHALTQEQTAQLIHVSQVQVSRIERKAVAHLRHMLSAP